LYISIFRILKKKKYFFFKHKYAKLTKCEKCINCLKTEYGQLNNQAADLVILKTRGFLTHPNNTLYKILETLEVCFIKHAVSLNPFEDI